MSDTQFENPLDDTFQKTDHSTPTFIVGIGASAGGLDAIERFFDNMPKNTGMAFVVVQHLSPDYKSLMDELLARHTKMLIHPVEDGVKVESNNIYLLPPRKNMVLSGGCLNLIEQNPNRGVNLPIDIFLESLATDFGNKAIGVILSGTGSDGSRGIPFINEVGGLVVVQDLGTASFDGMPRSATATGLADIVCCPERMPELICQFTKSPDTFERGQVEPGPPIAELSGQQRLFHLFRQKYGVDFSMYKPTTINRRLQRRIELSQTSNLKDYLELVEKDSQEFDLLYHDLLVEVTEFFRDPEAFEYLQDEVISKLIENASPDEEIRVWVPGCATGEEAFSIAMVFRDCAEQTGRNPRVKIFASDVHQASLESASEAIFSRQDLTKLPENMRRFFTEISDEHCSIAQEIRQMVVFARHDITTDPPFTRISLVSCRNLLIYLEPEVQKRVLALFHFALTSDGVLFLGPSETVGGFANEFSVLNQHWRFYRKLRDVRLPEMAQVTMSPPTMNIVSNKTLSNNREDDGWLRQLAYEDLLGKYVPPSLLINEFDEIVHSFGEARKLLVQPEGPPTLNVINLLEGDLRSAVNAALHRAKREKKNIAFTDIKSGDYSYNIVVEPWTRGSRALLMVCFEQLDRPTHPAIAVDDQITFESDEGTVQRIVELERELDYSRQSLQATVEELETSNEELQSTNEELIASNEELQSTNEELHSVNEELYTVNTEHQRKIGELTLANNDLSNLMMSSNIGTIFLDRDLRIRRFTPSISSAFHVLEQDVGRPIEHIAYNLETPNLMESIRSVLEEEIMVESEVKSNEGKTYLQRIQPYRSGTGEIQGVVLTYDDITIIRQATRQLEQVEEELAISQKELQDFAYAVSHDLGTPLRHISSHCRILQDEFEDQLPATTQKTLTVVENGAQRLRDMIDGLLTFSRVYSRGKPFSNVNLDQIMNEVVSELEQEVVTNDATITYDEMPDLIGDWDQIKQLLFNLIDNAIRFRAKSPPVIHVDAKHEGNFWKIAVHDNGIGIEKRHFERIFVIFQRLRFKQEVEGLGLGLAIARRIVERHNGWIWVESTHDKGSTFFFKLPAN
ncbi:chemotaxis protein CheB [Gimesia aquarii]|uniref:Phytochrome-like protein cph1 n=1 Tax=Gimesia aquarii TaxID=2527964 RepID=A0A517X045_9PLAN|nr:chemotaxis protein CheB [Gimesia aquarii]QDU10873.1 Phytochrome-like protein cph1 [Gimesia aquarii]